MISQEDPQREADTAYLESIRDGRADESSPRELVAKVTALAADPAMKELARKAAEAFNARVVAKVRKALQGA